MSASTPVRVHITTIVASLLRAFANGIHVLRRVRHISIPKRKTARLFALGEEGERKLRRSLKRGGRDIKVAYEAGAGKWGGGVFGEGDEAAVVDGSKAPAHSSLTTTLLALNTGLVNLINEFLAAAPPRPPALDFAALTALSEASREEALRALRAWEARLAGRAALRRAGAGSNTRPARSSAVVVRKNEWFRPRRAALAGVPGSPDGRRGRHRHRRRRRRGRRHRPQSPAPSEDSTQLGEIPPSKCGYVCPAESVVEVVPVGDGVEVKGKRKRGFLGMFRRKGVGGGDGGVG